jgi:hypothetical protein
MSQLTVYIDEDTLKKIELAARRAHESISKWVKKSLVSTLENKWPEGYFNICGSLKNEKDFQRPAQPSFSDETRRQAL